MWSTLATFGGTAGVVGFSLVEGADSMMTLNGVLGTASRTALASAFSASYS